VLSITVYHSSEITVNHPQFQAFGKDDVYFYYEAIEVKITIDASYTFKSNGSLVMDCFLYKNKGETADLGFGDFLGFFGI
jgi:hypothetical protein